MATTLTSPGVSVSVTDESQYSSSTSTCTPVFIVATRESKYQSDGTSIATGTTESEKLRVITSQSELIQYYGEPVFVTEDGDAVHGDETNEYGLMAMYSFLGMSGRAYILRADVDLEELLPSDDEPTEDPDNNTYWADLDEMSVGILTYDGTNWSAVTSYVLTEAPDDDTTGDDGDWCADYSDLDGTLMYKYDGEWKAATSDNLTDDLSATLWVSSSTPDDDSVASGDFWYNTGSSTGAVNMALERYRSSDSTWVSVTITRSDTEPTPNSGTVWEDTSYIPSTGRRPIEIGTGDEFISLDFIVQSDTPTGEPDEGTIWYCDDVTDFAFYIEGDSYGYGNQWVPITTTTASNPTNTEKYISASAPAYPDEGAFWVDLSDNYNYDHFPVIKQYVSGSWEDISGDLNFSSEDPGATVVEDGYMWVNTGDSTTKYTVKQYTSDWTAVTSQYDGSTYSIVEDSDNHWEPAAGSRFGRLAVRYYICKQMQSAVSSNTSMRAETVYFQLIACPGYPELYDEMVTLNDDIGNLALVVADTPKYMIPSGIASGREVTAADWASNTSVVDAVGEEGFTGTKSSYACFYYPWGYTTDLDGNYIFVPPSHMALRTIAYSDSVAYPWFAPAGATRGIVDNATSVGYLDDDGDYTAVLLNQSQRDILYENQINPIMNRADTGIVLYGQKTWADEDSALDRINVIRLIAKMRYDVNVLMSAYLFEPNDSTTRRSVTVTVERYLSGLKSNRALYDYAVQCDDDNNTDDTIDANELYVAIGIQPTKAIEFIYVPITVYGTGDDMLTD